MIFGRKKDNGTKSYREILSSRSIPTSIVTEIFETTTLTGVGTYRWDNQLDLNFLTYNFSNLKRKTNTYSPMMEMEAEFKRIRYGGLVAFQALIFTNPIDVEALFSDISQLTKDLILYFVHLQHDKIV